MSPPVSAYSVGKMRTADSATEWKIVYRNTKMTTKTNGRRDFQRHQNSKGLRKTSRDRISRDNFGTFERVEISLVFRVSHITRQSL